MVMDQLFAAAIAGDADARARLEIEADKLDKDEQTILHIESRRGNTEHVRFILREFAHKNLLVNLNLYKWTALHLAAHFGHIEVVKVLIDAARLLPSFSSANGHNPVSSFQAFLRQVSGYLNTALHMAVEKGYVDIVKLLVEADPNDRHIQDNERKTPLYLAADLGYFNVVKVICTTCTALSFDGPDGTALHEALRKVKKGKEDHRDAIKVIINAAKRSSCFEALSNGLDSSGCTVLQLAVNTDWADVVKLILEEDPA